MAIKMILLNDTLRPQITGAGLLLHLPRFIPRRCPNSSGPLLGNCPQLDSLADGWNKTQLPRPTGWNLGTGYALILSPSRFADGYLLGSPCYLLIWCLGV